MTALAFFVMRLPIDLRLCRLVFYGSILGCVVDTVVMAAGLGMTLEPLTLPMLMVCIRCIVFVLLESNMILFSS